jgi:hypothetical protein
MHNKLNRCINTREFADLSGMRLFTIYIQELVQLQTLSQKMLLKVIGIEFVEAAVTDATN